MIYGRALSHSELKALLAADRQRFVAWRSENPWPISRKSWLAVWLFRWSFFYHGRGRRGLARFFWQVNLMLTGVDITPITDIGPGLLILRPKGVTLFGVAGSGLTVMGRSVIGGGGSRTDIGAGPGRPLIGDDVTLDFGSMVLGPVSVGNRVYVGAGCVVMKNVQADCKVTALAPEVVRRGS